MAKGSNPFDLFALGEQTVYIETLKSDVTYRSMTMAESDAFNKRLLGDYDGKGDPQIDIAEATQINYEKVALCLISPAMSIDDLKALPVTASKAITEIVKAIDGREDEPDEEAKTEDSVPMDKVDEKKAS